MTTLQFRPAQGNLADTIPFFNDGEYHVFYLRGKIGNVPWEHLVTKDFLHWQELPAALVSEGPADSMDGQNMFTGCVLKNAADWHLFYTSWNHRHPEYREWVCHATSADGVKWAKHPAEAFVADGIHYDASQELDFRDPYVFWNPEEKRWWMLLCARKAQTREPVIGLAVSHDLTRWEQRPPLCEGFPGTPECPDLFLIDDTWYLLASPCEGVTVYRWAKALGGPWSECVPIDTPILYAAKRMFDGRRHILTGWQRDLGDRRDEGGFEWGGTMCIAREVFQISPGLLGFRPAPEVREAFTLPVEIGDEAIVLTESKGERESPRARLALEVPDDYRLAFTARLDAAATMTVSFRGGGYRLSLEAVSREITVSSPGKVFKRTLKFDLAESTLQVEAFVLDSIIEIFINDREAFSLRAYDFRGGALEFSVSGGGATIRGLRAEIAPELNRVSAGVN